MSGLISRRATLKHIEKIRQDVLMIDDIRESNIIMWGMNLLEEAVRNHPSVQLEIKNPCSECQEFECYGREFKKDFYGGSNEY